MDLIKALFALVMFLLWILAVMLTYSAPIITIVMFIQGGLVGLFTAFGINFVAYLSFILLGAYHD